MHILIVIRIAIVSCINYKGNLVLLYYLKCLTLQTVSPNQDNILVR